MKLKKETKTKVESLEGSFNGYPVCVWQYPNTVYIEVDRKTVVINRKQLKKFLNREPMK